jgi:hypothetical protein
MRGKGDEESLQHSMNNLHHDQMREYMSKNQPKVEILIDESVKWKLEAHTRKLDERITELEKSMHEMRRAVNVVTDECTNQFSNINHKIMTQSGQIHD